MGTATGLEAGCCSILQSRIVRHPPDNQTIWWRGCPRSDRDGGTSTNRRGVVADTVAFGLCPRGEVIRRVRRPFLSVLWAA